MKRLNSVISFLFATSFLASGQGYISFNNGPTTGIFTNALAIGGTVGLTMTNADSYYYALFVAPVSQTTIDGTLSGWTFTGNIGTNFSAFPGRMNGNGAPGAPDSMSVTVNGYSIYDSANFAVVGWSANIGTTWPQAETWWNFGAPSDPYGNDFNPAYFGISTVATNIPFGPDGGPYNSVWGLGPGQISGLTLLTYVPEPSTLALGVLCAAALSIPRRRK